MIPVINGGAHDDHGFTLCFGGIVGKLAAGALDVGCLDAAYLGSPGWSVGDIDIIVVSGNIAAAQTTINAVLCNLQVEHGGDQGFLPIG
ncbi:hypothetical protein GALL_518970 [mine drainage metagenome]|uniref:Uncharacterized protein n=1 Tax=mine drainage metagenome TaxID=410659 RepID=A0A1J5PMK4_9ZZZZ